MNLQKDCYRKFSSNIFFSIFSLVNLPWTYLSTFVSMCEEIENRKTENLIVC